MLRINVFGLAASLAVWGCLSGADLTGFQHVVRICEPDKPACASVSSDGQLEKTFALGAAQRINAVGSGSVSVRGRDDRHDQYADGFGSGWNNALVQAPPPVPKTTPTIDAPQEGKSRLATQPLSGVMVRVNGVPILEQEVRSLARWMVEDYLQRVRPASLNDENERRAIEAEVSRYLPEVVRQLIDRELLYQEAEKRVPPRGMELVRKAAQQEIDKQLRRRRQQLGFRSEDELREYLERQNISLEMLRRQVERSLIADEYLRTLVRPKFEQIDRAQLWDYYQRNLKKFERPERVEWQYIFISAREGARYLQPGEAPNPAKARAQAEMVYALAQKAKTAEEFARIAEQYSDGPSRTGDGEGHDLASIRPAEIAELVWKTPPGQVGPLVPAQDGRGYHIFRVNKHEPARIVPFEEACLEIRRELQNQIFQAERERILRELRAKAHIEYPGSYKPSR
jgi:hypothetical protein